MSIDVAHAFREVSGGKWVGIVAIKQGGTYLGPHLCRLAPPALVGPCWHQLALPALPASVFILPSPRLCWLALVHAGFIWALFGLVHALPCSSVLSLTMHANAPSFIHVAICACAHSCWSTTAIAPTPAAAILPPTFHPPLHPYSRVHSHIHLCQPLLPGHTCWAFIWPSSVLVHAHFVPTGLFGLHLGLFMLVRAI